MMHKLDFSFGKLLYRNPVSVNEVYILSGPSGEWKLHYPYREQWTPYEDFTKTHPNYLADHSYAASC